MSVRLKSLLMAIMSAALVFGFLHLFVHEGSLYNYERLHIFLFNLCGGGTILIYYTEAKEKISGKAVLFLCLAVIYAILAFLEIYIMAIITAIMLAILVDTVRIRKFSIFPENFFNSQTPVSEKFHQASLLCLSIGLLFSGLVILNNEYLKIISLPKLQLDTFFLGFSFPLSLITMSVMFSYMKDDVEKTISLMKNIGFWTINLGVIIFFFFILIEKLVPQVLVTIILFFAVIMIFFLFTKLSNKHQQKNFLTSGILFLIYTAITGIAYILFEFTSYYDSANMKVLLRMHSFAALYGWNLCGLAVICRQPDFPIQLHSGTIISIHWLTAVILAPLGTWYRPFAVFALIGYVFVLYMILFSRKNS